MKTKLELIKDVYGPYYERYTPDENGWSIGTCLLIKDRTRFREEMQVVDTKERPYIKWRPITLKGLEDNNGWTSISEHGVPKEKGDYWVVELGKAHIFRFNPNREVSVIVWNRRFTHWKPIDSRLPLHL